MSAIIPRGVRHHVKSSKGVMLLGVDLRDAREEIFVRMVCDGLALGIAYARAGFKSKDHNAPASLFHLPRVQERATAILEARRTHGAITLSEVTDMLQRVFAGAHAAEEYSAAHNAAFSLARLYGHVTDKATLEVIRRPSRDPDAPSEQVLSDWVKSLPVVSGPMSPYPTLPEPVETALEGSSSPSEGAIPRAPADLLGPGPPDPGPAQPEGPGLQLDLFNGINGLAYARQRAMHVNVHRVPHVNVHTPGPGEGRAGTENGAPSSPVTGTPHGCGGSGPLENGSPFADEGTGFPSAEELFG